FGQVFRCKPLFDLSQLLSGSYVAMRPGDGEKTRTFEGSHQPPPLEPRGEGTRVDLYADTVQSLRRGTPIVHKGVRAGEVLGVRYHAEMKQVHIDAFVNEPFDELLGPGARFWAGGDARISPRGGGMGVDLPTVAGVLQGRLTFARFDPLRDDAEPPEHYTVYASEADARRPLRGPAAAFRVRFPGSVEGLGDGAAVDLAGFRVGRVRDAFLSVDPEKPAIETVATLDLYAHAMGLAEDAPDAPAIRDAVAQLVSHGMRARLASSSLVLGGKKVSLVMTDQQAESLAQANGESPPEIPAVAGTDRGSLLASASGFVNRLGELPIDQIGEDLREITRRVRRLAASPEIDRSLAKLESALTEIERVSQQVAEATPATTERLQQAAAGVRDAARTIDRVTGGTPRKQEDIESLVAELTDTAASIRRLADLLHREPEALLRGRTPE
ncbi:MAG: MlaD family protein, partial [Phycisphaeraceae bacterium]